MSKILNPILATIIIFFIGCSNNSSSDNSDENTMTSTNGRKYMYLTTENKFSGTFSIANMDNHVVLKYVNIKPYEICFYNFEWSTDYDKYSETYIEPLEENNAYIYTRSKNDKIPKSQNWKAIYVELNENFLNISKCNEFYFGEEYFSSIDEAIDSKKKTITIDKYIRLPEKQNFPKSLIGTKWQYSGPYVDYDDIEFPKENYIKGFKSFSEINYQQLNCKVDYYPLNTTDAIIDGMFVVYLSEKDSLFIPLRIRQESYSSPLIIYTTQDSNPRKDYIDCWSIANTEATGIDNGTLTKGELSKGNFGWSHSCSYRLKN